MNDQLPLMLQIPFPVVMKDFAAQAALKWRAFCEMPDSTKRLYSLGTIDPACDDGYRMRNKAGEDPKEFFHVTHAILPDLYEILSQRRHSIPPEGDTEGYQIRAMLSLADMLLQEASRLVREYCEILAASVPGCEGLPYQIFAHGHASTLRFLHYLPHHRQYVRNEILAAPHIDQGGPTLHLYESDCGLEYLDRDNTWKDLSQGSDTTPCFGGLAQQYNTGVPALCHRVVSTPRTSSEGRWSIVCFSELPLSPKVRKAIRLSQFPPGFNYLKSQAELSSLFE